MNEENKSLVKDPVSTAVAAPHAVGRGYEDSMSSEDYEIPRAKIVQFTSKEAQAEKVEDRVAAGTFINGITKQKISEVFIPIFRYKTYTQWNPVSKNDPNYDPAFEPGECIFTTKDRHDPRVVEGINFGPNNETPKVTQCINYLCIFEGQKLPLLLSFAKSSFKGGKILNSLLEEVREREDEDMFLHKFKLTFTQKEKAGNKYYVMSVLGNGKASAAEIETAAKWYNRLRGKDIEAMAQKPQTEETE